ncbi:ScbR family autoregulator-binding transcription factor [Streptomyces sp. SL13]|uniref:ScbR family autoregulator-binding transcription factor n=1 Tax=Streptantibioticus silvisoli TaxID=2705255 RepID=A0AA90HAS6_9ACTN|nr:ScbR family autoregulator-binding transcription factor [Streptantibioticus silvisoli]MDI5967000.1 ScbR family autoregulator-binding transcription factor [Streptantibioticus silvisoli]MDI5974521.1 ScbR family autoregulator-binding transcription factor [Streptantibioticus silvisoli]
MVMQERAVRTRAALIRAAAEEMDRWGYEGATLTRICATASVSMGALTFHFSTKDELAQAVQESGGAYMTDLVDGVAARGRPALRSVVDLTVGLARLLQDEVVVRSAARLTRERPDGHSWTLFWLPAVRDLLQKAADQGQLRRPGEPRAVAALAVYLMAGAEARCRAMIGAGGGGDRDVAEEMDLIWELTLEGVAAGSG